MKVGHHRCENRPTRQHVASNGYAPFNQVTRMANASWTGPSCCQAIVIDDDSLTQIRVLILRQRHLKRVCCIVAVSDKQCIDSKIWVGHGLCGDSANHGPNMRHEGSDHRSSRRGGNAESASSRVTGDDREGHAGKSLWINLSL